MSDVARPCLTSEGIEGFGTGGTITGTLLDGAGAAISGSLGNRSAFFNGITLTSSTGGAGGGTTIRSGAGHSTITVTATAVATIVARTILITRPA